MKLKVRPLAYTFAIIHGVYLFSAALLVWSGVNLPFFGRGIVDIVSSIFEGYGASPAGAFAGLIYGLAWGGIWGWLIAWLYNKLI